MIEQSKGKVALWLLTGCLLIFLMVVIGGITRLTGSGLSITEWNVVMGAVPPLNETQWNAAFEKYQQIPQFQKLNYHYSLDDFKKIFFWEYLHRLIGRIIGVVFIIPFLYFYFRRMMDKPTVRKALFLFFLGALQGFLGWFMVKSGLTERTSVSHIRLAIHLVTAFVTFGFTFWYALDLLYGDRANSIFARQFSILKGLLALVLVQLLYGAFVAGLHAGRIANTFPTMDGQWIPAGLNTMSPGWINLVDNLITVQFLHRAIAYVIVIMIVFFWWQTGKKELTNLQHKATRIMLAAVTFQLLLGIFTLLSRVEITLAVLHQAGAFLLFASVIYAMHRFRPVISS